MLDHLPDPNEASLREEPLDAFSRVVASVAERVGPAVVRVESRGRQQGGRGGAGAGVIIAGDGLVLTNSHVVAGARQVRVAFPDGAGPERRGSAATRGIRLTPPYRGTPAAPALLAPPCRLGSAEGA